jgi:hypothetical protein
LAAYRSDPRRHASHASKVLLKFKLLEVQRSRRGDFVVWAEDVGYLRLVHKRFFADTPLRGWIGTLLDELAASGAVRIVDGSLLNA